MVGLQKIAYQVCAWPGYSRQDAVAAFRGSFVWYLVSFSFFSTKGAQILSSIFVTSKQARYIRSPQQHRAKY